MCIRQPCVFGPFLLSTIFILAPHVEAEPSSFEDFPAASRIWLCYTKGALSPTKEEAIISEGAGTLRILKDNNAPVEKGERFAIFRPEQLELEHESLLLERALLSTSISKAKIGDEENLRQLHAQKAEAETELQELEAASVEEEISSDPALRQRLQEAVAIVHEQIKGLDTLLEIEKLKASDGLEIQKLDLEQKRREQDFTAMKNEAENRSPFSGFFNLSEELAAEHGDKEAPYEFWIESAELIGHVTDNSSFEVTLMEYPPILNQVPSEQLIFEMQTAESESPLTAAFLEPRTVSLSGAGGRGERVLVFRVRPDERKRAEPLAGSTPLGQVFLELPAGCHLVPKADLIRILDGKSTNGGGWAAYARAVWPDSELVATGHLHLALRKINPDPAPQPKPTPDR